MTGESKKDKILLRINDAINIMVFLTQDIERERKEGYPSFGKVKGRYYVVSDIFEDDLREMVDRLESLKGYIPEEDKK